MLKKLLNLIARVFSFGGKKTAASSEPVSMDAPDISGTAENAPSGAAAEDDAPVEEASEETSAAETDAEEPAGPVLIENTAAETPEEEPKEEPAAENFVSERAPGVSNFQRRREITVDGVRYRSIRNACLTHDLDYEIVKSRMERGWTVDKAFHTPVQRGSGTNQQGFGVRDKCSPYCGPDKKYPSVHAMCLAHGVSYQTFVYRVRHGQSVKDALHPVWRDDEGRAYRSKESMCKRHHIDPAMFDARVKRGWSVEDALNVSAGQSRKTYHRLTAGYGQEEKVSEPESAAYRVDAEGFVHWDE